MKIPTIWYDLKMEKQPTLVGSVTNSNDPIRGEKPMILEEKHKEYAIKCFAQFDSKDSKTLQSFDFVNSANKYNYLHVC